jgi:hypothetical protein
MGQVRTWDVPLEVVVRAWNTTAPHKFFVATALTAKHGTCIILDRTLPALRRNVYVHHPAMDHSDQL